MKIQSSNTYLKSRVAIAAIFFAYGFIFSSWASRIPTVKQLFQLSESDLGFLLLVLPIGSFISLPIAGAAVSKLCSKVVVAVSAMVYISLLLVISYMPSAFLLAIALFLFGFMSNVLNISINTQAVSLEKIYKRNIMASFHGMWSVAGLLGASLGALMIRFEISLSTHFLICMLFAFLIALLAFNYLLTEENKANERQPIFVLPNKSLLILGIIAFCSMMCEGAMFDWSGVYFDQVVEAPKAYLGLAYTFFMITMAATRFIADYFTSRYGIKRIIGMSGLCSVTGLTLLVGFPSFYISLLAFLLIGVGVSSVIPLIFSEAGRNKSMTSGMALAAVSTMGFFGFLIGPPIIGFLGGLINLRASFSFLILMALLIVLFSTRLPQARR